MGALPRFWGLRWWAKLPIVLIVFMTLVSVVYSFFGRAVDETSCGTGDLETLGGLRSALVTEPDLDFTPDESPSNLSGVSFDTLGDEHFRKVVSQSRYRGGFTSSFSGEGRRATSIIVAFHDADAAMTLFEHPFFGNPTMPGPEIGQFSEWLLFPSEEGYSSHFLQFQVGKLVVYVFNGGTQTPVTSDEVENLAERVCDRLAKLG